MDMTDSLNTMRLMKLLDACIRLALLVCSSSKTLILLLNYILFLLIFFLLFQSSNILQCSVVYFCYPYCQGGSSVAAVTVEKNPKSLDVNNFDAEFDIDPLFRKTSAAFDDGGVEALLFTQLSVRYIFFKSKKKLFKVVWMSIPKKPYK